MIPLEMLTGRRPVPAWRVTSGPHLGLSVLGYTKSEARAAIKRVLGLHSLPPGTMLVRATT